VAECSDPRTVTNRQIRGKEREIAYKKETRPVGEETNKNGFFLGCPLIILLLLLPLGDHLVSKLQYRVAF
jgi:hypothetical protein